MVVVVTVASASMASCRRDNGPPQRDPGPTITTGSQCQPVVVDPLDPRSTQHLLPGAPPPSYSTDPPTSGPHASSGTVSGLQSVPIEEQIQVAVLEEGGIVVQYRPDLPAGPRETLARMADEKVVVAPNPSLPDTVVATAWRHRLICRSLDPAVLKTFIAERKGKGPG